MTRFNACAWAGAGLLFAGFSLGLSLPAAAQSGQIAHADLKDKSGKAVGSADLTQTAVGVLIKLSIKDLKSGEHAVHVHAVGKCDAPFDSAGPHFNPGNHKHGMLAGEGHAGDLPNLHVPQNGDLEVEMVAANVTLDTGKPNSLFDSDGSSLVIHAAADDYRTDPAGDSGERIACGVITSSSNVGRSTGK
jgi:Cu-Zn family superoxide dismutase